jgi:hypothetical protein
MAWKRLVAAPLSTIQPDGGTRLRNDQPFAVGAGSETAVLGGVYRHVLAAGAQPARTDRRPIQVPGDGPGLLDAAVDD